MIELRVASAKQRDEYRGIARLSHASMEKLGIHAGDVIEIIGEKSTAAIAWPAYSEDQDKEIIRIDSITGKNAETNLDEVVKLRPAKIMDAEHVTIAPVDMRLNVDEDFTSFVKNRLTQRAFVEGDETLVMVLGHPVRLTVTRTIPEGIAGLTPETHMHIESGPADKELMNLRQVLLKHGRDLRLWSRTGKRENTVMTRLSSEDLNRIDMMIGIGLFESRSEAVAYLTHEGIIAKKEMFDHLSSKFDQIEKIRDEAKALLGTSAPISSLKECPRCGKKNDLESKFCSGCGKELSS